MKQMYMVSNSTVATALNKANWIVLPAFTDEHNVKLNSACGVWQYLAQLWELKCNKSQTDSLHIVDTINQCMKELDPLALKAILETYNNDHILQLIGNTPTVNKKSDDPTIIHE